MSNLIKCPACGKTKQKTFGSKNQYKMFECQACSLIFVDPIPSNEELNAFYQNYHKTSQYTGKIESKQRRARKRIKSVKKHAKGKSFVDIGCNAGFAVEAARTLGLDAYGIDLDQTAIDYAKEYFPQAKFDAMSIQELAKTAKTFDIIYCSEVIEHLPELGSFVDALFKLLKPDGVLFLTTPDIAHYSIKKDRLGWDAVRPPEHLFYFSKNSLGKLFEKHGFKHIKFKFNFKPTLKVIIKK
jgi:SAM-dependent methyltransferase